MKQNEINLKIVTEYERYLREEEKSEATIEKYVRDVQAFMRFLGERKLCKEEMIAYKQSLQKDYAPASINSMLVAVHRFLGYINRQDCCVKLLKVQKNLFTNEEKELTKAEYFRLINVSRNSQLSLVMQTICGTGIRISELKNITVEAVIAGKAKIFCKNKTRIILIPTKLQKILKKYAKKSGIKSGPVFVTKTGRPLNRSNVWKAMKALCEKANVASQKVFPHNLRHLFARTFYSMENDIVRLADILGHSSINTTRIYTLETGNQHRRMIEQVEKILAT